MCEIRSWTSCGTGTSARARAATLLVLWIGLQQSKYFHWVGRYGKANEHNGKIPRDFWLTAEEKAAIVSHAKAHPLDGYRRLAFRMLDEEVAAASPTTVWTVLKEAGVMGKRTTTPSRKGQGFEQPTAPHQHWHIDISYININGTFYYLCSILDGYSRYLVHWDIGCQMTESDVERIVQRARELFPDARPRIISDNGPRLIARDFKDFIRIRGMTHVRTSPYYPQSNGKIERWHKTLKATAIRPQTPLSLEDAFRVVGRFVEQYNGERLRSAIGYLTPKAKLEGREEQIFHLRDERLEAARARRKLLRQQARTQGVVPPAAPAAAASL
jgi:transposase InsO family protein